MSSCILKLLRLFIFCSHKGKKQQWIFLLASCVTTYGADSLSTVGPGASLYEECLCTRRYLASIVFGLLPDDG